MTMETIRDTFGQGGDGLTDQEPGGLKAILKEMQGFSMDLVAGAAVDTNIAITGIKTTDTLLFVLHHTAAAAMADRTAEASITSDGNIQLSTTDTTGDQLLVFWYNKDNA